DKDKFCPTNDAPQRSLPNTSYVSLPDNTNPHSLATYAVTEKPNEHTFPQVVVDDAIQISRQSTYAVVATTPPHTEEGVFHMLAVWQHQHQHHASANPTTPSNSFNCVPTRDTQHYIPIEYAHMGRCSCICHHCVAMLWECEKLSRSGFGGVPIYNKCCNGGQVVLRPPPEYPEYVKELYANAHFMENIRAYNQMLSMASLRANIDSSINNGRGPYVLRISRQIYHWIGSMCPSEGHIELLDNHNALVQLFRTASNKLDEANVPEFKVKLYNVVGTRRYELPTPETIGAIVFGETSIMELNST
nr:hypothetical protein [Tanacetum cinerariifolium]